MTPEEQAAIERVEAGANPTHGSDVCLCSSCGNGAAESLRTVLRLAKRPYALREEERETLGVLRLNSDICGPDYANFGGEAYRALTAALSLASSDDALQDTEQLPNP